MRFASIQCSKMQLQSGSALNNSAGGVTARLPQILAGFKRMLCDVEGRGQGRRERDRKRGEVVGMLTLMRSCYQTA